jgi:hypothetical protein
MLIVPNGNSFTKTTYDTTSDYNVLHFTLISTTGYCKIDTLMLPNAVVKLTG